MKLAVVAAARRDWRKYDWVADALLAVGCQVRRTRHEWREVERWADAAVWEPKWLAALGAPARAGAPRVGWMFDLIATTPGVPLAKQTTLYTPTSQGIGEATPMLRGLGACDLAFVKERGMLGEYAGIGVNAAWFDQACPAWMRACRHPAAPEFDVLLLGRTARQERRQDAAAAARAGYRVAWAAPQADAAVPLGVTRLPFCPPEDLPELFAQTAVVLDCPLRSDVEGYWSDKLWLVLGAGACHLRRRSPGLPEEGCGRYFTYGDREEMVDKLRGLVADRSLRVAAGEAAREWVKQCHTYEQRAGALARICASALESAGAVAAPALC